MQASGAGFARVHSRLRRGGRRCDGHEREGSWLADQARCRRLRHVGDRVAQGALPPRPPWRGAAAFSAAMVPYRRLYSAPVGRHGAGARAAFLERSTRIFDADVLVKKSVEMNSKMDPAHLLSEIFWLADTDNFFDEWVNSSHEIGNHSAEEFYNTVFDDYLILDVQEIYLLSENMAYYIYNVALFLQKASPGHEEIDSRKLLRNPDFIIAQKICQIVKELCMGSDANGPVD